MTILVAITGGIGAGKSTFSRQVKKRGYKLLDSDEEVAKIYNKPNKGFLKELKKIGLSDCIKNQKINRKIISELIFSNKKIKKNLEKYIYEIIRKNRKKFLKNQKKNKTKIVFLDIPLLFENNLNKDYDIVISIVSKRKTRYKRLKKSKNMTEKLFNSILRSQTTDTIRKQKSDIIINNNSGALDYEKKINKVINKIIQ